MCNNENYSEPHINFYNFESKSYTMSMTGHTNYLFTIKVACGLRMWTTC